MRKLILGLLSLSAIAAPTGAQDRWDWHGGGRGDRDYELAGRGVPLLIPELRESNRGRAWVMRNFDFDRNGFISPREADAANHAFLAAAGERRDRFDWDARDGVRNGAVERGGWDRGAMRDYHFRQTQYGATFDIGDVLFDTNSARLRPAALDRLRPLARYLAAEPGVRVRIDGHTDARASDAYNQQLSEARAQSVADALIDMGADRPRFEVTGHGKREPIASNATAQGRQQNRRVEVTLLGQRADRFARD